MPRQMSFDVVVVGGGSAGAFAAACLARDGRRVALLEERARDQAGARWVNGVPAWMFEAAGVALPQGDERTFGPGPFSVLGPSGGFRVVLPENPLLFCDMRLLVRRLQDEAVAAGARLVDRCRASELSFEADRPVALTAHTTDRRGGERAHTFRARLFVDASGLAGALRRHIPALQRFCPTPVGDRLCQAQQEVRIISDRKGAARFMEESGCRPGETLSWTGIDGGFSVLTLTIDEATERAALLCGTVAGGQHRSPTEHLTAFVEKNRWLGERLFGGAGVIPLRRPFERIAAEGVALIGDAASMVFAAHGSGVGYGLLSGKTLAGAVRAHDDPGSLAAAWAYQESFQREHGGTLAAADAFCRMTQSLSGAEVEGVIRAGMVSEGALRASLAHRVPTLRDVRLPTLGVGLLRAPALALRLAPHLGRMAAAQALYAGHPRDPVNLDRWAERVRRLFGEP
ncbi:MAG: FAD-binding protein [Myxococcales bacterium]|nr:FAD-binding protein [Myxococcales bacterium]